MFRFGRRGARCLRKMVRLDRGGREGLRSDCGEGRPQEAAMGGAGRVCVVRCGACGGDQQI